MPDNETDNITPAESEDPIPNTDSFEPIGPIEETSSPEPEDETVPQDDSADTIVPDNNKEEVPPEEESRRRRFFRKFFRWTVGLLVVFGLGFLAAIFMIYNPKVDELDQSKNNLNDAGATISELEEQIDSLQGQIDGLNKQIDTLSQTITDLETQNQELTAQHDGFNLHIALLRARTDVVSAQVELYADNPAQARVLLESTNETLALIESLLPDDLKDVVSPLQNRLELAIGEIDNDPETAIADLGILAGDLLEIENALFGD